MAAAKINIKTSNINIKTSNNEFHIYEMFAFSVFRYRPSVLPNSPVLIALLFRLCRNVATTAIGGHFSSNHTSRRAKGRYGVYVSFFLPVALELDVLL